LKISQGHNIYGHPGILSEIIKEIIQDEKKEIINLDLSACCHSSVAGKLVNSFIKFTNISLLYY